MALEKEVMAKDALKQIDALHSLIVSQEWRELRRSDFVSVLEKTVPMLSGLKHSFEAIQKLLQMETAEEKPDLKELLGELEGNLSLVEKNKRFELQKNSRAREINVLEREETPEVYSLIEQKLLTVLLKARYAVERTNIFLRKQSPRDFRLEKGTATNLLSLLEKKENEFQELKGKYEDVRKRSYLGYIEEQTVPDLEKEVNETARMLSTGIEKLNHNISVHQKQLGYLETNYAELKQRLDEIEEKLNSFMEKSLHLASLLKKERDYAKRIVLEIEHETVQLRNMYTGEMLALQEEKARAGREAGKKYAQTIEKLERALEKSEGDSEHFRKLAAERTERARSLEQRASEIKTKTGRGKPTKKEKNG